MTRLRTLLAGCAALALLLWCNLAFATTCWVWTLTNGSVTSTGSASVVCSAQNNTTGSAGQLITHTYTPAASMHQYPTDGSDSTGECDRTDSGYNAGTSGSYGAWYYPTPLSTTCPANCPASQTQDLLQTIAAASQVTTTGYCVQGCQYVNGNTTLSIGTSTNRLAGMALSTGNSCGQNDTTALPATSCVSKGGVNTCVTDVAPASATINGDVVTPSTAPAAGTCVAFASGGAMCTVPAAPVLPQPTNTTTVKNDFQGDTPPSPDSGTAGTPALPTAIVQGGGKTIAYYTAAQIATSTVGVASKGSPTGTAGGSNTSTSASSTATGPGITGDCPPGQTCQGTGGTGVTDGISGGQDCNTPPACTDTDPVLCGIANQAWLMRCENVTDAQIATAIGTTGVIGASVAGDFSSPVNESTSPLGSVAVGGTCPAPVAMTVMGNTITIDFFSALCSFAGYIGFAVLGCAYLVAARLMFGAVAGTGGSAGGGG